MKVYLVIIIMFFSAVCVAKVNLCPYDLTPEQIKIIRKLEAKGTVSEETLIKLAKASQKHNEKENEYVPPHTAEELELVKAWAVGGVFQEFAGRLGLNFNGLAYMESYPVYKEGKPNMAIFNFGLATGAKYFEIDIMVSAISVRASLSSAQVSSPETFLEYFLDQISNYGFHIFLN